MEKCKIENGALLDDIYSIKYMPYIEKVTIGDKITKIGDDAFSGCSSLIDIEIPNNIKEIGEYAFFRCSSLTNINIPNSVINIGKNAFGSCENLEQINVNKNNEKYISIDGVLFNKNMSQLIKYPSKKENNIYCIPNSIKVVEDSAFSKCINLRNIEIPNIGKTPLTKKFYYFLFL